MISSLARLGPKPRLAVIRQSEAAECGLACLAMIATHHGYKTDLISLRQKFSLSLKGTTLKTLIGIAETIGLNGRAIRCEPDDLIALKPPFIMHIDLSHFVVVTSIERGPPSFIIPSLFKNIRYHINDPAIGKVVLKHSDLLSRFSGIAVEFERSSEFRKKTERSKLQISQLWSKMSGFKIELLKAFILSIVLQTTVLVAPLYMQTAIDSVIPSEDHDLLKVLLFAFIGLVIFQFSATWLRSWTLLNLSSQFGYQLVVNLFSHMIKLPLSWFERRHVGDVVSRFGSMQPVVNMITEGFMAALLDGFMAFTTLILMISYSLKLTLLTSSALMIYILIRMVSIQWMKSLNSNIISANAIEQSLLMETIRGILGIKAFGQEVGRQELWQDKKVEAVNAQMRIGRATSAFDALQQAVVGLEAVIFVYIAIGFTISSELTVGMVFAFQAYKGHFIGAVTRVISALVSWRLNEVHLSRLADIALSPSERYLESISKDYRQLTGKIELRNIQFSYGSGENSVLRSINIKIEPGQTIVIIGASGGGKTTLLKIMLGLLDPTAGDVLVDGIPLSTFGKFSYRRQIGVIMQDDTLYAGSIKDNIALFDPEVDQNRILNVTSVSGIAEEINKMPMRFETLVGDMGSVLSGGQRQRILIARALYRKPKIIFADEATSALDATAHSQISLAVANYPATKIIISHRPVLNTADRIFVLSDGYLHELENPRSDKIKSEINHDY